MDISASNGVTRTTADDLTLMTGAKVRSSPPTMKRVSEDAHNSECKGSEKEKALRSRCPSLFAVILTPKDSARARVDLASGLGLPHLLRRRLLLAPCGDSERDPRGRCTLLLLLLPCPPQIAPFVSAFLLHHKSKGAGGREGSFQLFPAFIVIVAPLSSVAYSLLTGMAGDDDGQSA